MGDGGWGALVRRAQRQWGVVSREQAGEVGLTRDALRWRLAVGHLERVHRGVYLLAGAPRTWEGGALAALLLIGPHAVLSHRAAAWVWRLEGVARQPWPLDVTVPYQANTPRAPGVRVHRSRAALRAHGVGGLRVTSLARTLLDLAPVLRPSRGVEDPLEDALDSAQRLHPGTDAQLTFALRSHGRGRSGAGRMGRLLGVRGGSSTDSRLEATVARGLRRAGVKRPRPQHEVRDDAGYVLRVDFAWPEEKVALHVDGYAYHQQRTRFERDRRAASRLTALGWRSVWVTHRSLEAAEWVEAVRAALGRGAAQRSRF